MTPTDEIRIRHKDAVRQSLWVDERFDVTGGEIRRRYKKRPIPANCRWAHPCEIERLPEPARSRCREIMQKHPRTRGLIVWVGSIKMPNY